MAEAKTNPSLRELVGAPVSISVGKLKIEVQPMGWYQASVAMEHLLPALHALPLVGAEMGDKREDRVALWAGVVITYRNEIAAFCAEASGYSREDVVALPPVQLIELVMGLVEVNADFFAQSLPSLLKGAQGRLARLMERWAPVLAAAAATSDSTTSSSG